MQKYIISILLLLGTFITKAQDTKMPERQVFIRAGLDLSRFALPLINDVNVMGFEASIDSEVKYDLFPTVEFGMNKIKHNTDSIDYIANGGYFRVGLDYNMLNYKHRLDRNIFYIGARYGFCAYSQQADNIIINNEWGDFETNYPKADLTHHWAEALIGLRGEILKNFFMGVCVRVKFKLATKDYGDLTPYFIPGYGEGGQNINVGMSYSVFYAIPIKRLK